MFHSRSAIVPAVLIATFAGVSHAQCDPATTYEDFSTASALSLDSTVSLADIDGDGDLDLFVHSSTNYSIYLNQGDGSLGPELRFDQLFEYRTMDRPVVIADLNGDGLADVVDNDAPITIGLGNGDGTFVTSSLPASQASGLGSNATVADDINGDGFPDIIRAAESSDVVEVFFNDGTGNFSAPADITISVLRPREVTSADFDGDGDTDL